MIDKHPAMKALESLTPGGSEYVDDVDRCLQTIQHTREMQMKAVVMLKKQRDAFQDVYDYVMAVCHFYPDDTLEKPSIVFGHPSSEQWSRIVLAARKAKYEMDKEE